MNPYNYINTKSTRVDSKIIEYWGLSKGGHHVFKLDNGYFTTISNITQEETREIGCPKYPLGYDRSTVLRVFKVAPYMKSPLWRVLNGNNRLDR